MQPYQEEEEVVELSLKEKVMIKKNALKVKEKGKELSHLPLSKAHKQFIQT